MLLPMELIGCRKELSFGFFEIRYTVCSTARRCFFSSPQIKGGEHLRKTDTGRSVLRYNINITYEEEDVSFTE